MIAEKKAISLLDTYMDKYGITSPYMKTAILGIILSEGGFDGNSENMNYSKERLPEVWGKFSKTGKVVKKGQGKYNYNQLAENLEYKPEDLANFIYGDRLGNGGKNTNDGWTYRGRGLNQLTGKGSYEKLGKQLGVDLVNNPELLNEDPDLQAHAAVLFLYNRINKTLPRLVKNNSSYKKRFKDYLDYNNIDNLEDASFLLTSANAGFGNYPSKEKFTKRLRKAQPYLKNYNLDDSGEGKSKDKPVQNESVKGATGTPLDKAPITNEDNIVNKDETETETESLETGVDEVYETPQVGYNPSSGDAFRLSDSAQMSLFGTIIYPRGGSRSGVPSNDTFYQDLQNTNEEDSEFGIPDVTPEPEGKGSTTIPVDPDANVEDSKQDETDTAWWKNKENEDPIDEKKSESWRNVTEEDSKKRYGRGSYKKDPYMSYLDGDMTKEEYQKYLRTQPEFKKDFDKVENTLSGYREKFGKATKNSVGGTSYILTSDQIKKQRKIAKDFADKYGYSTEGWITDKEFVKDEARDMLSDGLFKSKGLQQDVKKYNEEYADYNRLKAGFSKAGWDIDDKGNISFNGEKPVNTIQNIIKEEKDNFSKFDFNANDGQGDFVVEKGRETDLALKYKNQECSEKDMYYVKELGRCGTLEELNFHAPCPGNQIKYSNGECGCPPGTVYYGSGMGCLGPQGAGSADGFWAGTLLGPTGLLGTIGTYIGDALGEIVLPPAIDLVVDSGFDAYTMGFGNPMEKVQVYEKYAQPIRDANARYDKADGFLNGINAFFGGDANYNTGSWYNFDKGGSIELDLNKKEVLKYAQNGYIVEEVGYDDPVVKQRRGVRKNPDGTVSSHLMRAELVDGNWVAFPSLFQDSKPYADDQQNWVDMSEEEDWMKIYKEAERRGEVYNFGKDKEAALAFGMGSWKDQLPEIEPEEELYNMERARELGYERDGLGHLPSVDKETGMFLKSMDHPTAFKEYMYGQLNKDIGTNTRVVVNPEGHFGDKQLQYIELTDEEADKYRAGGYVLEELKDGGGTYTVKSGDTFNAIAYANGISPAELAAANPKISADKLSIGQILSIPKKQVAAKSKTKVAKKSGVTSAAKKSIQSMPSAIDLEGLKKGIAHVESADGTLMMNPTSSATGLYGQLYNEIKDLPELKGVTREQFAKNIDLQNKIFEKRFYEGLPGVPALQKNAEDLYKEYSPQIKNFGYSKEDIVALSNFLGRQGTRNYFGSIRDSKKFKAPGINKTPSQYLEGTRPSYISKEKDGGFIERELTEEEIQQYIDSGYIVEEVE